MRAAPAEWTRARGREHASGPPVPDARMNGEALVQPERLRRSKAEATSAPTSACSPASRATPASARRRGSADPSLVGSSRSSPRQTDPLSSGSKCGAGEVRDERDRSQARAAWRRAHSCCGRFVSTRPCKRRSATTTATKWIRSCGRRFATPLRWSPGATATPASVSTPASTGEPAVRVLAARPVRSAPSKRSGRADRVAPSLHSGHLLVAGRVIASRLLRSSLRGDRFARLAAARSAAGA